MIYAIPVCGIHIDFGVAIHIFFKTLLIQFSADVLGILTIFRQGFSSSGRQLLGFHGSRDRQRFVCDETLPWTSLGASITCRGKRVLGRFVLTVSLFETRVSWFTKLILSLVASEGIFSLLGHISFSQDSDELFAPVVSD